MTVLLSAGLLSAAAVAVSAPDKAPDARAAYAYQPPPWFQDAKALIQRRGGRCTITYPQTPPNALPTGATTEDCNHRIPTAVAQEFGQNPARGEVCGGNARELDPLQYLYTCRVFYRPGTEAHPNRASWPCRRSKYGGQGQSTRDDQRWTAEKTKRYRKQTFTTLKRCLTKHLRRKR